MLAVCVKMNDHLRSTMKSVTHSGLKRRTLTEIHGVAKCVDWECLQDFPGLIRRAVVYDHDRIA